MPFVEIPHEKLLEEVSKMWRFGSLPYPRWEIVCPFCKSNKLQVRFWGFHKKPPPSYPYRCDLWVKCTKCTAVFDFGVAIPREMFLKWLPEDKGSRRVDWEEAKEIYYREIKEYGNRDKT